MGVSSFNSSVSSVGFSFNTNKSNYSIAGFSTNNMSTPIFQYEKVNLKEEVNQVTTIEEDDSTLEALGKFGVNVACTITASHLETCAYFLKGIVGVGEDIVNAGALAVADIAAWTGHDEYSQKVQNWIATDKTQELYDNTVGKCEFINEYSAAPDWLLSGAEMVGTMAAYTAINAIPGGGTAVSATVAAAAAAGGSAQTTLQNGGDLSEANVTAGVAAATAVVSRYGLKGVEGVAKTATSMGDVAKYAAAGAVVSEIEPVANNVAQYATWGKDLKDENGNNLYGNYFDYAKDSGLGKQMIISGGAGAFTAGNTARKSYVATENYRNNVVSKFNSDGSKSPDQIAEVQKAAENTIDNVKNDYKNGVYNKQYSVGDILEDPDGNQLKYWSPKQAKAYYDEFGKYADADGNVKVYCFQNGDPGGNNIAKFGGSVGPGDGAFATSEEAYLKIIHDPTLFEEIITTEGVSYKCIDAQKLSQRLGNVNLGSGNNVIAVEQTVKLMDISPPNANNSCAYPGDWSPGGRTVSAITGRGDCIEGVVPQGNYSNGNVNIISHGNQNAAHYIDQL